MTDFSVTVLGASPAWANPGGACSGYLVSNNGDTILVECGFGILSRVRERLPLDEIKAIVISHLHADHFMDLVPLRYGLKYGGLRSDPGLPLFAPPEASQFFARLGEALDDDARFFDGTYQLHEYQPGRSIAIGSLTIDFQQVKHYVPSFAMAIRAGKKLAYSADAAPCPVLTDVARDADLFLCEAAIDSTDDDDPNVDLRGHMTAPEAAQVARDAGARRLLLTHYRATLSRDASVAAEVEAVFGRPAEFAEEGRTYRV